MKKERTLLFIGIWVALLPHLGFPNNMRKILFLLTGLFIIFIAYVMYKRKIQERIEMSKQGQNSVMNAFSESSPAEDVIEIEEEIIIEEI